MSGPWYTPAPAEASVSDDCHLPGISLSSSIIHLKHLSLHSSLISCSFSVQKRLGQGRAESCHGEHVSKAILQSTPLVWIHIHAHRTVCTRTHTYTHIHAFTHTHTELELGYSLHKLNPVNDYPTDISSEVEQSPAPPK